MVARHLVLFAAFFVQTVLIPVKPTDAEASLLAKNIAEVGLYSGYV